MNTCPNCGKIAGLHSSILQGCMCQYSMQAPPKKEWVGLTEGEMFNLWVRCPAETEDRYAFARAIEVKLKEKNHG